MITSDLSGDNPAGYARAVDEAGDVQSTPACTRCSNVANVAEQALRAIETGQIARATALLKEVLALGLPVGSDHEVGGGSSMNEEEPA